MDRSLLRIGAVAAVVGAALLFVSTLFHPLQADPNDALAAAISTHGRGGVSRLFLGGI